MALPGDWRDVADRAMNSTKKTGHDTPDFEERKFKIQQKVLQEKQRTLQATISGLKKQAKALEGKKDSRSKALLSRINSNIKTQTNNLTAAGKQLKDVQNKYYTSSGQYSKLLSGANRDAFLALESVFKNYGLESLAGKIYDYVKNGYSSDTISLLLQDTKEYKQRFAANETRIKNGLPVLSPADYINTENAYRQLLRQSGLPEGFYDSTKDFTEWIAKDVSPTEIQSRVDLATQATALANPYYKAALNQMGIDDGHMAAYFLDVDRALPLLQKAAATAAVGSAALSQGLTFDKTFAEQLATSGVSASEAQQGYSQVAQELGTMKELGNIYGQKWSQNESEQSVFGTSAGAAAKKAGLVGQERGAFGGSAGGGKAGLSQSQSAQ
jgi:hypothetical protein